MVENILAEAKPTTIKLADGKDYTFPPLSLTTLANLEKILGFPLKQTKEKFESEPMQTLLGFVYALLIENYPQLTREEAGKLVTFEVLPNLTSTFAHIFSQIKVVAG